MPCAVCVALCLVCVCTQYASAVSRVAYTHGSLCEYIVHLADYPLGLTRAYLSIPGDPGGVINPDPQCTNGFYAKRSHHARAGNMRRFGQFAKAASKEKVQV